MFEKILQFVTNDNFLSINVRYIYIYITVYEFHRGVFLILRKFEEYRQIMHYDEVPAPTTSVLKTRAINPTIIQCHGHHNSAKNLKL